MIFYYSHSNLKTLYLKAETFEILFHEGLKKITLNPACHRAEYIMQISKVFMHTMEASRYCVYTGEEKRQETTVINNYAAFQGLQP